MNKENVVYLSLGSNLGDRLAFLKFGVKRLGQDVNISIIKCSSIYETAPVGLTEQPNFLNMVVELQTIYQPLELLKATQAIQQKSGREFKIRWGPRTLDLDILLFNQENIEMDELSVPHPRMHERGFVIIPLRELAPSLYIPSVNKSVQQVYEELLDKEGVRFWKNPFGVEELEHFEN